MISLLQQTRILCCTIKPSFFLLGLRNRLGLEEDLEWRKEVALLLALTPFFGIGMGAREMKPEYQDLRCGDAFQTCPFFDRYHLLLQCGDDLNFSFIYVFMFELIS